MKKHPILEIPNQRRDFLLTKFNEHMFALVTRDLLEVLANQNLYWLRVPILRNLLSHQMWLKVTKKCVTSSTEYGIYYFYVKRLR